jgi:hypothetical protein
VCQRQAVRTELACQMRNANGKRIFCERVETRWPGVLGRCSIRSSEVVMSVPADRKRLLCRFNLHHKWVRRFNQEDGEDYLPCAACGEQHSYSPARML